MKKNFNIKNIVMIAMVVCVALFAFGAVEPVSVEASDAFKKAISSNPTAPAGVNTSEIQKTAGGLVWIIIFVGSFWVIGCIAVGAIMLAGSGSNPQRRTGGMVFLAFALLGGYALMNTYKIAGFLSGL